MKLSETELEQLVQQLRCPDGNEGIKVAEMMNFTNSNIISKTIDNLQLKPHDTLLEIGPGNASHVKEIISIADSINYYGIDISETMVAEAKKLNKGISNVLFTLSDGATIPFNDNYFSKIFTVNTIYFWNNPAQYVKEIWRVLKQGGKLNIGFIPKSTMQHIPFAKYGFKLYDTETVSSILKNNGFIDYTAITETELVKSNSGEDIEREFVILSAIKK
jgi:ubiquinone/menaquinone biosynthesis C-methylase UbiE